MPSHREHGSESIRIGIGAAFDSFGGMPAYIQAIKKFSSHEIVEVPSQFARILVNPLMQVQRLSRLYRQPPYGTLANRINLQWIYQSLMNERRLKGFDILHSQAQPWFTSLCQKSESLASGWVHTYHTLYYFEEDYPNGLQNWQKNANSELTDVASQADVRLSVSHWLRDYLLDRYSINTTVIPNGVDSDACASARPDRFMEKYGIRDFVLFVGNLSPVKNPGLFVDLASLNPGVKFVMIGRDLRSKYFIKEYGRVPPKNVFLMGAISHSDTLDAISACRAIVMTSRREGLPTALLESLALGKPVVAPNHSGCREVVVNKDCGYLFEPNSLADLQEKTELALQTEGDPEVRKEFVLSNYDWRNVAGRIDAVYESLL